VRELDGDKRVWLMEHCDCVIIGAGVVGLAVARQLARAGRDVLALEAEATFGTITSSRNSEVIHAGLYYPPGSLKALLCRRGRELLYSYLQDHGIAHLRCGKLVVATDEAEVVMLKGVQQRALANAVEDLQWLSGADARACEPQVRCLAALHSPSTGIFDSHGYMLSLKGEAEAHGAAFAFHSRVAGGAVLPDGIVLDVECDGAAITLFCRSVVNCAGLGAQAVAGAIRGLRPSSIPKLYYNKGCYFSLTGRPPFSMLVYPPPDHASIGLHYTRDLSGRGRFGPDTAWVDRIDYDVEPSHADRFYTSIRRYWPDLPDGALAPDYAGIRPKLQSPQDSPRDFMIQGPAEHGVTGLINLYGIESPGLTSSLAIAEHVETLLAVIPAHL
jgi:L-2-hydroxyglutarate oxidase LhgO